MGRIFWLKFEVGERVTSFTNHFSLLSPLLHVRLKLLTVKYRKKDATDVNKFPLL